jgi:hypothetical protein
MLNQKRAGEDISDLKTYHLNRNATLVEAAEAEDAAAPLDDAARSERDYVRERLREELKHEPTDEELDEWLRQHTEGY